MAVPHKRKEGTKGSKQIVEENSDTLNFYRAMALGASAIYLAVMCIFFEFFTAFYVIMFIITSVVYIASLQFMNYMARAQFTETGQILHSGVDLNMTGGIAEHVKDMIILTAGSQFLSLLSNYFWLTMLLAPTRGFYLLWVNFLSPYFFQEAPPQEIDEKKQKKLERKMRRQQH